MRIVFMGTPDFADISLKRLLREEYEVRAVFTQPDKPVGRKQVLTPPKTKVTAKACGIEVYQPRSLKTAEIEGTFKEFAPDLIVVVAYGKILPKEILECPRLGCVNVHASLLPKYRGAAPIQWSIIKGEEETGVTTMLMDEGMDTGDILLKESIKIEENETSGELFERLADIGAELLIKTIKGLETDSIIPLKQPEGASYAPMLDKSIAKIDFTKTSNEVHNLIRGLNPWPIAYTEVEKKKLKIYRSKISGETNGKPGEILNLSPFIVCCGKGTSIELKEVQLEGKKKMGTDEFINGFKLKKGMIFGGIN